MNRKIILTLVMLTSLALVTGCLFKSGANPVADSSIAQSQKSAQTLETVQPQIMSSAYTKPATRQYTFAKSAHEVKHAFCDGVAKAPASLRVSLLGADTTDSIFITFEKMVVKSEVGARHDISMESRKIDMLSAAQLSEILAEQELPAGIYNYLEFAVQSAELVIGGETHLMKVPSNKIRFVGKFEIKDGYTTNLKVKFLHRVTKFNSNKKNSYMLMPVVKIASELIAKPAEEVTDGDVAGSVESFVNASKLSGVNVTLEGTSFTATTDLNGAFSFTGVPAGVYTLKTFHQDYLDHSFALEVAAGQVASVSIKLNPAVINSTVANTGWFAKYYPLAEVKAEYGEVSVETPVTIDFVSLAFVKAEIKFTAEYNSVGTARCRNYLGTSQQVSASKDLGEWWAGNTAVLGNFLGDYYATQAGVPYIVDVTDLIRSNPGSTYFLATRNMDVVDIRMTGIQLSIYYR